MITKLTPAQERELPRFRQKWLEIGTSTDRADRKKAERAILTLREEIKVTTKPVFVWCESPATCLLALHVIQSLHGAAVAESQSGGNSLKSSLGSSLKSSLGNSLRSSLGNSLGSSLESSLWNSLWNSLGSSLESSLESSLGSSLESSLWNSLGSSLESSLRSSLGSSLWGQYEAYWVAFYLYCQKIGVKYEPTRSRQLNLWRDVISSCGWWWCYENYVIISERPTIQALDDQERLHSEDGPAMAFSDGWKLYCYHGVEVPEDVILRPKTLRAERVLQEPNAEVRRVLIERVGLQKLLKSGKAETLHKEKGRVLYQLDLPGDEPLVVVKVTCPSTGRIYLNRVRPDVKTCQEAVASRWRLTADEYHPEQET